MPKSRIIIPTGTNAPRLIIRTRKTGDIILCDYCQNYKCGWLDYSPANYPKSCPGIREFWIADGNIPNEEFLRRTAIARQVGLYLVHDHSWHIDATKAGNLSAEALGRIMEEIGTWSTKNRFSLCNLVKYVPSRDQRPTVQAKLEAAGRKKD